MSDDSFCFFDEKGNRINHLESERTEQDQASLYIPEDAKGVLELGARYGTVTYAISKRIGNRPILITVEPDSTVWPALEDNLKRYTIHANIVKGAISRKPLGIVHFQYSSFTADDPSVSVVKAAEDFKQSLTYNMSISTWTLEEIQEKTNIPVIDVLVADCEGFLEQFMEENPTLYKTLRVIIFEKDFSERCNYNKIQWHLHRHGFREIVGGFHAVWIKH